MYPALLMHREMELYVMVGVPNLEAIKACTFNAAKVLRRDKEFVSLQIGLSADLLLVKGDPSTDIGDPRAVQHVFMRGKLVDRDSLKLR
jgi:imidazolonepropionase-like amidohydrolase